MLLPGSKQLPTVPNDEKVVRSGNKNICKCRQKVGYEIHKWGNIFILEMQLFKYF